MNEPQDIAIPEIRIETSKLGQSLIITSVSRLAEYLLYEWPVKGGKKHYAARVACMSALEGELSGGACRVAFLEACKEANVFVFAEGSGRPEPRAKPKGRGKPA